MIRAGRGRGGWGWDQIISDICFQKSGSNWELLYVVPLSERTGEWWVKNRGLNEGKRRERSVCVCVLCRNRTKFGSEQSWWWPKMSRHFKLLHFSPTLPLSAWNIQYMHSPHLAFFHLYYFPHFYFFFFSFEKNNPFLLYFYIRVSTFSCYLFIYFI